MHHAHRPTKETLNQPGALARLPEPDRSHPPRLLLVDDEQINLSLWGQIFSSEGYLVTTSCVPESAARLDMRAFDLAIIDFDMPGCDGRTLLLRMRSAGATFPIILLSGSIETLPHATLVLFSCCISKPAKCCELLAIVSAFMNAAPDPDC